MSGRRFNADTPLDPETKRKVEELKRDDPEALEHFEQVRESEPAPPMPCSDRPRIR
jgi:hypothetical protein